MVYQIPKGIFPLKYSRHALTNDLTANGYGIFKTIYNTYPFFIDLM